MLNINDIDFEKQNGLVPAVIQDATTMQILMLGYMNMEALQKTLETMQVTFFSRSKNRLWTKGESSGHFLDLVDIQLDCDNDTLLIQAIPHGNTCHLDRYSCFGEQKPKAFLYQLQKVIATRKNEPESSKSYTASLFRAGSHKIAQKVGEEAVELVIEAMRNNDELFLNESADLLYHFLVLLQDRGFSLEDVEDVLMKRHK
jgi:phosphoribosyl-ATP pyrophosphohydrolase/phosphoribosyl-AMP cyclohydrolase